jgi:hypothetical protein
MFFIRESCPCGASPRDLGAAEGGGEDTRFVEFDEFLDERRFPGTATHSSWLKPYQAMISLG